MSKTAIVYTCEFEDFLRSFLRYDPDTGDLYLTRGVKGRRRKLTEPLGTVGKGGYVQITVKGKQLKAHRVAWFLFYGGWPEGQVDHINKDTSDNRIENLRVGASVNQHNRDIMVGASGLSGAHKSNKKSKPFKSSIKVQGKTKHLGYFKTSEEAHKAYMKEKESLLASQ